nr:hypothetical protein [Leisingera sp. M523]
MEYDAKRVPCTAVQPAHTVAHVYAIGALGPAHRSVAHGKDHGVTLSQGQDLGPALHARALLRQHELTADEVPARLREKDGNLKRKQQFSIDILMKAVVVAFRILQQQRRRPYLPRVVASAQVVRMPV